jgi:hypothetical protein
VALPRLLNGIGLVVFLRHDFIQMNFVVKEFVELQAFERLEHFFDLLVEQFDASFVIDFKTQLGDLLVFLQDSRLFLFDDEDEQGALVVLGFDFPLPEVNNLSKLIHAF